MLKLNVHIIFPDGSKSLCGEIFAIGPNSQGKIEGSFRYTPQYLKHPKAFALDPEHLPLIPKEFSVTRREGIHGVFEDALPDDWGRKLLFQKANLLKKEQTLPNLLKLIASDGLGALIFHEKDRPYDKKTQAGPMDLPDLLDAAIRYEAGLSVNKAQLKLLHDHGSSPGGARPKAVIQKSDKTLWLSKFPVSSDKFNIESLEAGCLDMARQAGLQVPEFELAHINGKEILLVKRFDISGQNGRYHMISMQTLLGAEGYYYLGYTDLFDSLRKHSFQPSIDIPALFRQMVFNAVIGNTDDHLKNFCMLHKENGFCLSPAYDVLPDVYEKREHSLSFPLGMGSLAPGKDDFLTIAKSLKIPQAKNIMEDVFAAISNWKHIFKKYGVPEDDIKKLEWGINKRLSS